MNLQNQKKVSYPLPITSVQSLHYVAERAFQLTEIFPTVLQPGNYL
jgi:hypothetical protein